MSERPAQAELQFAIRKLEQLGDYQSHFGANSDTILSPEVPYYQEYNYLHRLVTTTQPLVDYYDDTEWLTTHHVTNQTFKDALIEMQNAHRCCTLILGLNRTEENTKETNSTSDANSSASNTNQNSSKPSQSQTSAVPTNSTNQANNSNPSSTASTNTSQATSNSKTANTPVKAEVFTPATNSTTQIDTTDVKKEATINDTDESSTEITVPATGNVDITSRQVSWPALFAVVIAGAVVASIAIAVIIRHEPHHPAHPRRRH